MTNKLYDDLYPRLNLLIGIRSNFNVFYNSWWTDKCLNYKGDKLSDYYDIFFSRFVTFNSLYNTIVYTKECMGLLKKKTNKKYKPIEHGDKKKATTLMSRELSDSELNIFFKKTEINKGIAEIVDIIETEKFVITHKAGQQVPEDDLLILDKLKNTNKKERYLGILEILYNVRCNLFHGTKGYENDQIILLKPLNEILFYIVEFVHDSFKNQTDNMIEKINKEIEKLEKK